MSLKSTDVIFSDSELDQRDSAATSADEAEASADAAAASAAAAAASAAAAAAEEVPLTAGTGAATANTTALQAALDAGGLVLVILPDGGVAYVNDALVLKSNTILDLNGGTLKMTGSASSNMFQNYNFTTAPKTVTGNITAASLSPSSNRFSLCTVVCAAHGFAASSYVLVKGDTTGRYNGIHQVWTVPGSGSFTFLLPDGNHADVPANSAGTITATQADAHIWVRNGRLDSSEPEGNNNGGNAGHQWLLNKVLDFRAENLQILRVNKFGFFGCNMWSPRWRDIYFDTGSDGIHCCGMNNDVLVDGASGRTGDDVFAYTSDEEPELPLVDSTPATLTNVTLNNILVDYTGSRVVLLAGDSSTTISGVRMNNIRGRLGVSPAILIDSGSGGLVVEDVVIDGISAAFESTGTAVIAVGATAAVTVKSLTVRGARKSPFKDRLDGDFCVISNASTITKMVVEDADLMFDTANSNSRAIVYALAGSTVADLIFIGCKTDELGNDTSSYQWCRLNGDTSSYGRVEVIGGKLAGHGQVTDHDSTISATYILGGGFVFAGSVMLGSGKGAITAVINGVAVLSAEVNIFNFWGTSKTYNLYLKNLFNVGGATVISYGTTNTINLLASDASVQLDPTKLTISNGAQCLDTSNNIRVKAAGFLPTADDGLALGSTSFNWSDLFLASGGVINWNNGVSQITATTDLVYVGKTTNTTLGATPGLVARTSANDMQMSMVGASAVAGGFQSSGSNLYFGSWSNSPLIIRTNNADRLNVNSTALAPSTNNAMALGTTALGYSGLFLAQTPSAVGTGAKTISNASDSSTNFGHYLTISCAGTTYYVPCSATAPA